MKSDEEGFVVDGREGGEVLCFVGHIDFQMLNNIVQ
jgi:hypothetical protein